MNMKKAYSLVVGAVVAALYAALCYMQEFILPGTSSMAVQFRLAEALSVFCLFTPAAIPGLTVGCLIANLIALSALPLDMVFGAAATFFASAAMYKLRNIKLKDIPMLSLLMPAVFNGVIIAFQIEVFFIENNFHLSSFLMQFITIAAGEIAVLFTLGLLLLKIIKNKKLEKYLFPI